mmetsp:Transcript_10403/g.18976  ORF Transcript_10403/g.18976 Transcript_10403/m.18976 type:complete len:426 (+) Transcript_10403:239-1516(+)
MEDDEDTKERRRKEPTFESSCILSRQSFGSNLIINQIAGLEQPPGNQSCGYYALYFCTVLRKYLSLPNYSIEEVSKNLSDRGQFNAFIIQCTDYLQLIARNKQSKCYPWTQEDVKKGILEFAYLKELQTSSFGEKMSVDSGVVSVLFGCGLSTLKTNHPPLTIIREIERNFNHMESKTSSISIFLVGASIHYMAVAVKSIIDNGVMSYEIFYCDPQNKPILGKADDGLQDIVQKMEFRSWINAGWKREKIERLCLDTFKGLQHIVQLMALRLVEGCSVKDELMEFNLIHGFLHSYYEYVGEWPNSKNRQLKDKITVKRLFGKDMEFKLADPSTPEGYLSRLHAWSSNFYPPAVIQSNVVGALHKSRPMSKLIHSSFSKWKKMVRVGIKNAVDKCSLDPKMDKFCKRMIEMLDDLHNELKDQLLGE